MKFSKINFSKLLFEFVSVSFAVLLALLLSQWREDRNNTDLAQKAMANVREEFVENKETILNFIPNHKSTLVEIDSILKLSNKEDVIADVNIDINLINSSAWEMAKITNAVYYLDFEVVNNLAKVYKLQTYYESIVEQFILKSAASHQVETDEKYLLDMKNFLETIIPLEDDLVGYYDLMLEEVITKQ